MQIQQYLRMFQANWWIVLAVLLISTGVGLAFSYAQIPVYEATATFVVNPTERIAETDEVLYSLDTLAGRTSLATTYSNVLKSRSIIEETRQTLGMPPEMLAQYEINAVVLPDSNVLRLQVQGPSPEVAAELANAIGATGLAYVSQLQEIYELRRLDIAVVEPVPISPNHLVDVALAVFIGIAAGIGFVILRETLIQGVGAEQKQENIQQQPAESSDRGPMHLEVTPAERRI